MALTATATVEVRRDICRSLKLRSPTITCTGFDRLGPHYICGLLCVYRIFYLYMGRGVKPIILFIKTLLSFLLTSLGDCDECQVYTSFGNLREIIKLKFYVINMCGDERDIIF